MAFRKSKPKTDNNSTELNLTTLSETESNNQYRSDVEKLQNKIAYNEKKLDLHISDVLINLDAHTDDIRSVINQKLSEQKPYKSSISNLWLQLKTLEQMERYSLIYFLRVNHLHRPEIHSSEQNLRTTEQDYIINPRRSRLVHFHISPNSDEFNINLGSYVGLLLFSYDNQIKFILNGHYCQRGDILIKQMKGFNQTQRGIYDALFRWYFGKAIDEKFFGVGFICSNGKIRFDLITYDERDLFRYEYQIFDMFLLTHWLTQYSVPHNAQDMESNAKDLLLRQYDIVKARLIQEENNIEILENEEEFINNDLKLSIEKFLQKTDIEIEYLLKETSIQTNIIPELLTQNTSE